jgi:manganese efflux pump family protein
MGWLSLLGIALALAMDAFAVAIVTGLSLVPLTRRHIFRLAFHFGLFQALMPILGWSAGAVVYRHLSGIDHWIACGLLVFVGGRMIFGALRGEEPGKPHRDPTRGWDLVILSVATSLDALAVGLTLAMLGSKILLPALVIGVVAASLTWIGMVFGRRIGDFWGKRVEVAGGIILIAIGIKIVLEHLLAK